MKISEDSYLFNSNLNPLEFESILNEKTLKKNYLVMESTNKEFIGLVEGNKFSIIDSFFPIGVACVIKGEIKGKDTSEISIVTSLHKAFRILYIIASVAFILSIIWLIFSSINQGHTFAPFLILLIIIPLYRLMLHGLYIYSRNRGIKKLKQLL